MPQQSRSHLAKVKSPLHLQLRIAKVKSPPMRAKIAKVKAPVSRRARIAKVKGRSSFFNRHLPPAGLAGSWPVFQEDSGL